MNGSPASITCRLVTYEFTKPPRANKVPGSVKQKDKDSEKVTNQIAICSSDPTGADNYAIARLLVLGETPYEGNDFRVLHFNRITDAMGYAKIETVAAIAGKAPSELGFRVETETDDEDDPEGGEGSIPPSAGLN